MTEPTEREWLEGLDGQSEREFFAADAAVCQCGHPAEHCAGASEHCQCADVNRPDPYIGADVSVNKRQKDTDCPDGDLASKSPHVNRPAIESDDDLVKINAPVKLRGSDQCECDGSGLYPNEVPGVGTEWVSCPLCDAAAAVPDREGATEQLAAILAAHGWRDNYDDGEHVGYICACRAPESGPMDTDIAAHIAEQIIANGWRKA